MRTPALLLAAGALLALSAGPSSAGPCTTQISRLDRAMGFGSPGATKRGAHRYNDRVLAIEAALDRARFYDKQGKKRNCTAAVNEAKRLMTSR